MSEWNRGGRDEEARRRQFESEQRDWARRETYDDVLKIVKEHSGAYGMGVDYAYTMVHKAPERVQHGQRIGPKPAK